LASSRFGAGCLCKAPPLPDYENAFLQEKAKFEPNIGKSYWLKFDRRVCPTPVADLLDCTSIPGGTKLKTDGIERGMTSEAYYHVQSEDGRSGYILAFELVLAATDVDPMQTAADCIRRGERRVGMTAKQVEASCWGMLIGLRRCEA
jgi:hypothetical protein